MSVSDINREKVSDSIMRLCLPALRIAVLGLALLLSAQLAIAAEFGAGTVAIETASGTHRFDVEVAETGAARALGLMHRADLAEDAGMWFDFERPGRVSMWMKNTLISLDMFFVTEEGRITRIESNTTPLSLRVIESGGPVRFVLETNAGVAEKIGARPGDNITFSFD